MKAAFFDIDGTIYREGLITEVFKKIIKYELVDETKWYKDVRPSFIKWDKRQGGYDEYLLKMVDIYTEAIRGISNHHIEYIAKKVIEQKVDEMEEVDNRELILFCKTPRTRKEICDYLGLNSVTYAIQTRVMPLVEKGIIKMSIPEKPKSPKQLFYCD